MSVIWGLIVIILLIIEFLVINVRYIFFSLSALISLIVSLNNDNFALQFILFIILGIVFNITLHDKFKRYLKKKRILVSKK